MGIMSFFRRAPVEKVEVDDVGVERRMVDGRVERIGWKDLASVSVITTSEGPEMEDLYICLQAADGSGCAVPNGLAAPVLGYLTKLPGFDVDSLVRAFCSTDDAQFLCWSRR